MPYKCRVCGFSDVASQGDICDICALEYTSNASPVPYPSNSKKRQIYQPQQSAEAAYAPSNSSKRQVMVGNNTLNGQNAANYPANLPVFNPNAYGGLTTQNSQVQVYAPGSAVAVQQQQNGYSPNSGSGTQSAVKVSGALTEGIVKNISTDQEDRSILVKLFRCMFSGIPFSLSNDLTMFQVFPDFSGTATNSRGNACDQVVVYGKMKAGTVSENNDVEVYGRRDSNNNIIATKIVNKGSGTITGAEHTMGPIAAWILFLVLVAVIAAFVSAFGPVGIVWSIVAVLILTNLPTVFKVLGAIFAGIFTLSSGNRRK